MKCVACTREVTFPAVESIEQAALRLDREPAENGAAGAAIAYLAMVAGCMRGRCIMCQPVSHADFRAALENPAVLS